MSNFESIRRDRSALLAELEQAGANVSRPTAICCPFHDDRNPSAGVFQGGDGVWRFKCHCCCAGGDVFDLRARITGQPLADVLKAAKSQTCQQKHVPNAEWSGRKTSPTQGSAIATVGRKIGGTDWAAVACSCIDRMDDDRLAELAGQLRVSPAALRAIGCGWHERRQCFTFPERDGDGNVIGVATRGLDGKKGFLRGGQRGLTVPDGLDDRPDPVLIDEGASDVAACLTHGIAAVGRPSNSGGVDHLATLIQNRLADRAVIVMGDNDAKAKDGSWPGRDGAIKVAAELTQRLGREIKWAMPPRQVKDIRELLTQMGSELTTESARLTVGRELVGQLASDSFRPPIESRDGRNELGDPILASDLDDVEDVEYVVEGLIARGHITVLVSHPKDGKTTFAAHVVKAMGDGAQLAGSVAKGRVLIVTEESKTLWKRRRDELRLGEWVEFYIRPILGNPTQAQWEQLIEKIARLVQERDYTLVIFDTVANLSPVIDENDAGQMKAALRPLQRVTEAGVAVLLIHHLRKSEASHGQGIRGSSAFAGYVDFIMELHRYDPKRRADRRRVLKASSRFAETPDEVVIELSDDGYHIIGTTQDASRANRQSVIKSLLSGRPPGGTAEEILKKWRDGTVPKPGKSTLKTDLDDGVETGLWNRSGDGVKGDPHRYYLAHAGQVNSSLPSPPSIGGRNESDDKASGDG